jgi:hypothetical protein
MFHDNRELRTILSTQPAITESSTCGAVGAYFNIGVESAALSKKLLGNTQKMWLNAATHKDAKDVARATSAFVNASYRDIAENAVAIARIWRRFIHAALSEDRTSDSLGAPVVAAAWCVETG